jgi:hypothetical protein
MKHLFPSQSTRIYFAGKITRNGWRHSIIPELRSAWWGARIDTADPSDIEPVEFEICDKRLLYVGPYFVGCDHGCFHGPESHGIIGKNLPVDDRIEAPERYAVFNRCIHWLSSAHVVFAHIETQDAQGSMFELGWAHCQNIPTFINFTTNALAAEYWFPARGAMQVSVNPDPGKALVNFLPSILAAAQQYELLRGRGIHHHPVGCL